MLDKEMLKKIKRLALKIDHDAAFGGKSKGNHHLQRVVRIAEYMADKLDANVDIVEAGAWLHDVALPSGNDYDSVSNRKIVVSILEDLSLPQKETEAIGDCVSSHEGTAEARTLEAKIVHDADVLEKSGVLGIIRHTWKLVNSGQLSPTHITKNDAIKILDHLTWRSKRLETSLAKIIHSYLSVTITIAQAQKIVSFVAKKAFCGVITEKIASSIYEELTVQQKKRLREQLNLSYLKKIR